MIKLSIIGTILYTSALFAQQSPPIWHLDPYNPEYADSRILVKLIDESEVNTLKKFSASSVLSAIRSKIDILETKQLFPNAKPPRNRLFKDFSGKEHSVGDLRTIYKLTFADQRDAKEIAEEIAQLYNVEFAEPDYFVYAMEGLTSPPAQQDRRPLRKATNTVPNDPLYGNQWYLGDFPGVNAEAAWDSTTGDTTQIIAIIDTGVDWDHPDLDDNIWRNWSEIPGNGVDDDGNGYVDDIRGWDFVNDDNDPNDDNSHGTHVAGIAAAEGNNGVGICGVAWNAKIMPVKMLQSSGSGSSSDLAQAIDYAANNGATVINMSLGSYAESLTVKAALENAYFSAVLVAAAGNDGLFLKQEGFPYGNHFPGCYSFVLGVEASNNAGNRASFSNIDPTGPMEYTNQWGHNYELKAPGVSIHSTFPNGNYNDLNGTSMACPVVSGTIALMKDYNSSQSTEQLFARLIQGTNSGILDIYNSLDYTLVPDLYYMTYTLIDTLPGCDEDGAADAGETIELYLMVKNAGGFADSVWSKLRLGQFEDPSVASITDSTSQIGDISAYATLTGGSNPFRIYIDSDVVNNRDIVFEYEIGAKDHSSFTGEMIITVQNGIELSGTYLGIKELYPSRRYIVTSNTVCDSLIIHPGTIISFYPNVIFLIDNYLRAIGTPDSLIEFVAIENSWEGIKIAENSTDMYFNYCKISDAELAIYDGGNNSTFSNCIFCNNKFISDNSEAIIDKCVITKTNVGSWCVRYFKGNMTNSIIVDNESFGGIMLFRIHLVKNNAIFDSWGYNTLESEYRNISISGLDWGIYYTNPNYYGVVDSTRIENLTWDFYEEGNLPIIISSDSALFSPPEECHGIVWKVDINNILVNKYDNPYNSPSGLGGVGAETLKFDVYFNRAMDTTYTPLLTFGVREPYTQNVVQENAFWSSDSTIWTAYFDVGLETGDGIQMVRVADARDDEHFEIPIEDSRFEFIIQAAGAASNQFLTTVGVGKVDLEWPTAESPDVLGYNMYRCYNLTDSTYSDTTRINTTLITDTTYTDFAVIPDTTYHYAYKVLGTDMAESDYSKFVTATPVNAASGDANGDMVINVQDIVSIVSYILEQNPQPFLFEAADVNSDGEINVLDVVETVNMILGAPKAMLAKAGVVDAILSLYNDRIRVRNVGSLGGLQFVLTGEDAENLILKPSKALSGFEIAKAEKEGKVICVIYSMSKQSLKQGESTLFTFEGNEDLTLESAVGSTPLGKAVGLTIENKSTIRIPEKFILYQNYPNPFNPETTIKYGLPKTRKVRLTIYNLLGRKVRAFEEGIREAGYHQVIWDSRDDRGVKVASGVYLYRIEAGDFVKSGKMVVLR